MDKVRLGLEAFQLKAEAWSIEIRPKLAALRLDDTVEQRTFDAHMVVEPLDVADVRNGATCVQVDRRRRVCRERNRERVGHRARRKEAGNPETAGSVGL